MKKAFHWVVGVKYGRRGLFVRFDLYSLFYSLNIILSQIIQKKVVSTMLDYEKKDIWWFKLINIVSVLMHKIWSVVSPLIFFGGLLW